MHLKRDDIILEEECPSAEESINANSPRDEERS